MRKPEQSAEPSIEEILASIRRIIADDGAQPPARAGNPQPAHDAPIQPMPAAPRQNYADPYYAEPAEPAEYAPPRSEYTPPRTNDDEILELTEDFMVEEEAAQSGARQFDPASAEQDLHASLFDLNGLSRPGQPPSGQELESVISNVVAEVQRLSEVGTAPASRDIPKPGADEWAPPLPPTQRSPRNPASVASWPAPDAAADAPRSTAKEAAPPSPNALPASSPTPKMWPASPPAQADTPYAPPSRAAPSAPSRAASKPVWSARHLGGETPATRPGGASAKLQSTEAPARPEANSRANWNAGVQMPVPDSGPTAPFPEPPGEDSNKAAPSGSATGDRPEIEKDKTFVGEMLTRVFGNAAKVPEEPKPAPAASPVVPKAEELAKSTIAEFAKEKLRAPSVAEALHADKPFMDAITDSLEHAMAETQATRDAAIQAQVAEMPEFEEEEELPEAMLPPDSQSGSFEVGPSEAHGMPPTQFPPLRMERPAPRDAALDADALPDMPELPRHEALGEGLRRAHAEMARAEAAADARLPASAPPTLFPTTLAVEPPLTPPALFPTTVAAPPPVKPPSLFPVTGAVQPPVTAPPPVPPLGAELSPGLTLPPGIEDTIKELIKPLIVQWLNENLPRIVEKAVREELAGQGLSRPLDGPRR